jgi:hypothetical protein
MHGDTVLADLLEIMQVGDADADGGAPADKQGRDHEYAPAAPRVAGLTHCCRNPRISAAAVAERSASSLPEQVDLAGRIIEERRPPIQF